MRNRFIPVALVLSLATTPACTFVGAAVGAGAASHSNAEDDKPPEHSVAGHAIAGTIVGLLLDALVITLLTGHLETDGTSGGIGDDCIIGCGGY